MPAYDYIPADEYTDWSTASDESNSDLYHGGTGLIGGVVCIIWDAGQNSVIYPPSPKAILPPPGNPHVDPPRVKRTKVPPPSYL